MKYKIGDKVKYDGGDWWLYGTVSAVFDHSICPCYRLNVERMEKKSCKFSITQFEFELEPCNDYIASEKDARKWEVSEVEYLKKYYGKLSLDDLTKVLQRSPQALEEKWEQTKTEKAIAPPTEPKPAAEPKPKPKPVEIEKAAVQQQTQKKPAQHPPQQQQQQQKQPEVINTIPLKETGIITDAWIRNLEDYKNGKKNNLISAWASQNRKEHKSGKLLKEKYERLKVVNFVFDTGRKKKADAGTTNWKNGKMARENQVYKSGAKGA